MGSVFFLPCFPFSFAAYQNCHAPCQQLTRLLQIFGFLLGGFPPDPARFYWPAFASDIPSSHCGMYTYDLLHSPAAAFFFQPSISLITILDMAFFF